MSDDKKTGRGAVTRRDVLKFGAAAAATGFPSATALPVDAAETAAGDAIAAVGEASTIAEEYVQATKMAAQFEQVLSHGTVIQPLISSPADTMMKKGADIMRAHGFASATLFNHMINGLCRSVEERSRRLENELSLTAGNGEYQGNMVLLRRAMKRVRMVRMLQREPTIFDAYQEVAAMLQENLDAVNAMSDDDKALFSDQIGKIERMCDDLAALRDPDRLIADANALEQKIAEHLRDMQDWPTDNTKIHITLRDANDADIEQMSAGGIRSEALHSIVKKDQSDRYSLHISPTLDALRIEGDKELVYSDHYEHVPEQKRCLMYDESGLRLKREGCDAALCNKESMDIALADQNAALRLVNRAWLADHPPESVDSGALHFTPLGELRQEILDKIFAPVLPCKDRPLLESSLPSWLKEDISFEDPRDWFAELAAHNAGALTALKDTASDAADALEARANLAYDLGVDTLSPEQRILATLRAEAIAHAIDGVDIMQGQNAKGEPQLQLTISDPELVEELSNRVYVDAQVIPEQAEVASKAPPQSPDQSEGRV